MGIFTNQTIGFDFNKFDDKEESFITFNGLNTSNIVNGDKGVFYRQCESKEDWVLQVDHLVFDGVDYATKTSSNGLAEIATASPYLEIPFNEFNKIVSAIMKIEPKSYKDQVTGLYNFKRSCAGLNLPPLEFDIQGLQFTLPMHYYTRDMINEC